MGCPLGASIVYGYKIEEDTILPWDTIDSKGDDMYLDDWWYYTIH